MPSVLVHAPDEPVILSAPAAERLLGRGGGGAVSVSRPLRRRIETTGMGDGAIIKLLVEMFELADYFFRRTLL